MKKSLLVIIALVIVAIAVPALAANPFMDVPANHWAYDAVAQLASRGILSGFPDGSYKGAQPATRYEMASALARAMARVDMEKASKQDVELLKKLIVEFKDELDALGVKVDKIDARLAVMEKDLGGFSMSGEFRFDAKFGGNSYTGSEGNWYGDDMTMVGKNEFDLNRYRFFIKKRINETTNFTLRLGGNGSNSGNKTVVWERYYITTKLPYDITLTVGKQLIDWEGDLGLYADNDAWLGDWAFNQIGFQKNWGMANLKLVFGRNNDSGATATATAGNKFGFPVGGPLPEQFLIAANIDANFTEKFRAGFLAYYLFTDKEVIINTATNAETDTDLLTLGAYMGFAFTPSIELKALYYMQDLGATIAQGNDDSPAAWKVMLDVKQEALKYTSLWLEYGQIDNTFVANNRLNSAGLTSNTNPYAWIGAEPLYNQPFNNNSTTVMLVRAEQKWNDKWSSYLRYFMADFDTAGLDDATNWTVGIGYQLNPNVGFELAYDNIDYGNAVGQALAGYRTGDDHLVRFRTYVTF